MTVALSLLQRKHKADLQVLLRLVRVLKTHMHWSVYTCSDVILMLTTLFLSVDASGIATIESLVSLISEVIEGHNEVDDAVQMALVQWATTPRAGLNRPLIAQQLCNWTLTKSFEDVATLLHAGSRFKQATLLQCLLVYSQSTRDCFVQ